MKILLCGNSVGGHLYGLKLGLERLGHTTSVVYNTRNQYGFDCDKSLYGASKSDVLNYLEKNLNSYDIVHYSNGDTLVPDRSDLRITRNKPIFFTFNGTSTRSIIQCLNQEFSEFGIHGRIWGRKELGLSSGGYLKHCLLLAYLEFQSKLRVSRCLRHASHVFALNPDLYIPRKSTFIPYAKSSFYSNTRVKATEAHNGPLRIAHAPTSRLIKGSNYLIKAVKNLQKRGYKIELSLIENMTNKEAISAIFHSDLLVDQLLVGWYGGVAAEAMQMGIPVMCYLREYDLLALPPKMKDDIPIINVTIDDIEQKISECYHDREMLAKKAHLSRLYALHYHDPVYSAQTVIKHYNQSL